MSLIVSDTTPLNYLILIGRVDVLPQLFDWIIVPQAVVREMLHPKAPPVVSNWAAQLPAWVDTQLPEVSDVSALSLGPGETEAISIAMKMPGAILLMDDLAGRLAAEERDLVVIGTIKILDLADEAGLLRFEEAYDRLAETTFHIEEALVERVLASIRVRRAGQGS